MTDAQKDVQKWRDEPVASGQKAQLRKILDRFPSGFDNPEETAKELIAAIPTKGEMADTIETLLDKEQELRFGGKRRAAKVSRNQRQSMTDLF